MAIIEGNTSELPEDDQLNDDSFDTNLASARDKNTPIGGGRNRNAADDGENLVARQQRVDKNTPIGG